MVNTVIRYTNVTVGKLLHGNINLTTDANQEIFKAVHKYVRQSKRFITQLFLVLNLKNEL